MRLNKSIKKARNYLKFNLKSIADKSYSLLKNSHLVILTAIASILKACGKTNNAEISFDNPENNNGIVFESALVQTNTDSNRYIISENTAATPENDNGEIRAIYLLGKIGQLPANARITIDNAPNDSSLAARFDNDSSKNFLYLIFDGEQKKIDYETAVQKTFSIRIEGELFSKLLQFEVRDELIEISQTIADTEANIPIVDNLEVTENSAEIIIDIDAKADDELSATSIEFSLAGTDADIFIIDANGRLSFRNIPDFTTLAYADNGVQYEITIVIEALAADSSVLQTLEHMITVRLRGGNRQPYDTANFTYNENIPVGTQIGDVFATITPEGQRLALRLAENYGGLFAIDSASGILSFAMSPDFESLAYAHFGGVYHLTVIASPISSAGQQQTMSQDLTVTITDVNEAPYSISLSSQTLDEIISVPVLERRLYEIGSITITDPDGEDSHFRDNFLTISATGSSEFEIIDDTLYLVGDNLWSAPNYEVTDSYTITLSATERTDHELTISETFTITVIDIDEPPYFFGCSYAGFDGIIDEPPYFFGCSYAGFDGIIAEDTPLQTYLFEIEFIESDSNYYTETIHYELEDDYDKLFTVLSVANKGKIALLKALDYEMPSANDSNVYRLNITAYSLDSRGNRKPASNSSPYPVDFTITDVNEAPSDISLSGFGQYVTAHYVTDHADHASLIRVTEAVTQAQRYLISSINVDDPDSPTSGGNTIRLKNSADSPSFQIEGTLLYLSHTPDYATQSHYHITLIASDANSDELTYEKEFHIVITNANRQDIASFYYGSSASHNRFPVSMSTLLSFFHDIPLRLAVLAFAFTKATLQYYDNNDMLQDITADSQLALADIADKGFIITTGSETGDGYVSFIASDASELVVFQADLRFSIGTITDTVPAIYVTSRDFNDGFEKIITISGTRLDIIVSEGLIDADRLIDIAQITAQDTEAGAVMQNISYSELRGSDAAAFAYDPVTNTLSFANLYIDYETSFDANQDMIYEVSLTVTEPDGVANSDLHLNIIIKDVNEAPTAIGLSDNRLSESSLADGDYGFYLIGDLTVTDSDSPFSGFTNNLLRLSEYESRFFAIIDNRLYLKRTPDYEAYPDYFVTIEAVDAADHRIGFASDFNIAVLNDSPLQDIIVDRPTTDFSDVHLGTIGTGFNRTLRFAKFTSYFADQDSSLHDADTKISFDYVSPFLHLSYTDYNQSISRVYGQNGSEQQGEIIVRLADFYHDSSDFTLELLSGAAGETQLNIAYRISDSSNLISEARVNLIFTLAPSPNRPPVFFDSNFDLDENSSSPVQIATISASDPDSAASQISYFLENNTANLFTIGEHDGVLTFNGSGDYETQNLHKVIVKALENDDNSFYSYATVLLSINDVNEAPVAIRLSNDTVSDCDDAVVGGLAQGYYLIGVLQIVDPDINNSAFRLNSLALAQGGDNEYFTIIANRIYLRQKPDYDTKNSYDINIVTNGSDERLGFTENFTINIQNCAEEALIAYDSYKDEVEYADYFVPIAEDNMFTSFVVS